MLFETLQAHPQLWTIGDESHGVFESINALHPATKGFASNALDANDINPQIADSVVRGFRRKLRDANGMMFCAITANQQPTTLRFLEKTPKNALRIPFLRGLFPTAQFIFLHRSPQPNIGSIIDAWQSRRFVTYPRLPNWTGSPWSLLLCESWRDFIGRPIAEIASWQWASTNRKALQDLNALPDNDWISISYESLLANKAQALEKLCAFMQLPDDLHIWAAQPTPNSKYTLSQPAKQKWQRHQHALQDAFDKLPLVAEIETTLKNLRQ